MPPAQNFLGGDERASDYIRVLQDCCTKKLMPFSIFRYWKYFKIEI